MIKGQPCTICKKPDDYSDETICHNCIEKWKKKLEEKERKRIIEEVKKHPRMITEGELNKLKNIELSYTGEMIPVEVVEEICSK